MISFLLLGLPALFAFCLMSPVQKNQGNEVKPDLYLELAKESKSNPALKRMLSVAMEDDQITYSEVTKIRNDLAEIDKETKKNYLRDSVGVTNRVEKKPIPAKEDW